MRGSGVFALAGLLLLCVPAAHADVRSYCAQFARDEADRGLNGSAILSPRTAKPLSAEDWKVRNQNAFADCLALYSAGPSEPVADQPPPEKPKPAKPAAKTKVTTAKTTTTKASATALVPGSDAWKDFCASKYVSFNRDTGTYKSHSGKMKPCVAVK